jgi:hypothetical protein
VLHSAGEYSGAYYLAGYAVECGLKACFAKSVREHDFPDKDRAAKVFTHKLRELVKLARLESELSAAQAENPRFSSGWDVICEWIEDSRYSIWTEGQSEAIVNAIVREKDGVLPWIKRHW